eukprot:5504027-Alexandrium_andersonii.AAC.1
MAFLLAAARRGPAMKRIRSEPVVLQPGQAEAEAALRQRRALAEHAPSALLHAAMQHKAARAASAAAEVPLWHCFKIDGVS